MWTLNIFVTYFIFNKFAFRKIVCDAVFRRRYFFVQKKIYFLSCIVLRACEILKWNCIPLLYIQVGFKFMALQSIYRRHFMVQKWIFLCIPCLWYQACLVLCKLVKFDFSVIFQSVILLILKIFCFISMHFF